MQRKTNIFSLLESYFDMAINALSIYAAFFGLVFFGTEPPYYPTQLKYVIQIVLIVLYTSAVHQATNNYNLSASRPRRQAAWSIVRTGLITFGTVVVLVAFFGKDGNRTFSGMWALTAFLISTLLLLIKMRVIYFVLKRLRKNNFMLRRTLIVGDNTASVNDYVREIVNDPDSGVMILGVVGDKIDCDVTCERLGSFKDFEHILNTQRPTDVVFAIDSYDKRNLIRFVNLCDDRCIRVYFLPVIYGFFKNPKQVEQIGNIPIINAHTNPLNSKFNAFVKRIIDIFGSIALILLTSPIMLVAVIGIKLTSDGPILFKQERVGRMGKKFMMYKFRSMPVNKETETNWSAPGDARPTKFGSFIRRTAIDELPQFFNVLKGQMSLVGPRPEMPKYVQKFRNTIPLYMIKHYVKPGITGLAQIKGLRGDTSLEDRIQADIHYIENWSLALDIMILLKTPFKAFNKYERYVNKENAQRSGLIGAIENKIKRNDSKAERTQKPHQKILYAASTTSHLRAFHSRYIQSLRDEGHEVFTMANGKRTDFSIPFEKKIFSKQNKKCREQIKKIIEEEKFDLIILNTSLAAFHIRRALDKKNRPRVVNIVHGYLFPESTQGFRAKFKASLLLTAEKSLRSKTDAILVMNDEDFRIATRNNLTKGPIIPTFGMGVPEPKITQEILDVRQKNANDGDYIMLFAGELSKRKNQAFLIDSLPILKKSIPNIRLWLLGDGDELKNLKQRAEKIGMSNRVNFFGKRKNPADFMKACDLYVSPSTCEGLPFNVVEALSCGKIVLATNIKGHKDILSGGAGILYRNKNMKDFCENVIGIYNQQITISERKIFVGYRNFSEESVFYDTYEKLKEASWL